MIFIGYYNIYVNLSDDDTTNMSEILNGKYLIPYEFLLYIAQAIC